MTKIAVKFCSVVFLLSTVTTPVWADTYRWVDDNGVVNYSERKPRGVDADRVTRISDRSPALASSGDVNPSSTAARTSTPSSIGDGNVSREQQDIMRGLREAEANRQVQITKVRQVNCTRSRRVLTNLTARDHIRVRGEDGTERVLPEEERQQGIADAQQGIVDNCDS